MKTTILLDAGGVLIDESLYEQSVCSVVVEILCKYDHTYNQNQYWKDVDESIQRYCPSTPKYVLWKHIQPDISKFKMAINEYSKLMDESKPQIELFSGIGKEIQLLSKKFKLLIAGQYGAIILDLLEKENLLDLFENQLTQDAFNVTKPDPRYIEQIAHRANLKPYECIMVGDRIDKDVIPGHQNGMGTVFLRTGIYKNQRPRIPQEIPDLILDSIEGMAVSIISHWTS
jgi:FMN phosphatase YigB (HAD superfamily)